MASLASQKAATAAMVAKFAAQREDDREVGRRFIRGFDVIPPEVVACVMLYWAEGKKSKKSPLGFCNSDARMIKLFFDFLVKYGVVARNEIKIAINFYDNVMSVPEVESYWLGLLGLDRSHLYKTHVNKRPQASAGSKIGKLPHGVCTIYHSSKRKKYQIEGMIEELNKFLGV